MTWWRNTLKRKLDRVFWRLPTDPATLRLSQSRIYLLPTRRGWGFVLLLAVLLLIALNYAANLVFMLTFLLAGYLLTNFIIALQQLHKLELTFVPVPSVFMGDSLQLSMHLRNHHHRHRQGLCLDNGQATSAPHALAGKAETLISLHVTASRRGLYPIGRLCLSSTAPAGLVRAFCYLHHDYAALIYPKPEAFAPPAPLSNHVQHTAQARLSHNHPPEAERNSLREFQAKDSPRDIAWQRYQPGQKLRTKYAEAESAQGHEHHLRYHDCGLAEHEARLSRLCAWVRQCQNSGSAFDLDLPACTLKHPSIEEALRA
ncbi:MAG: hypothetical protein RLZZ502_946, partial [Pseudomonadota bacterium]